MTRKTLNTLFIAVGTVLLLLGVGGVLGQIADTDTTERVRAQFRVTQLITDLDEYGNPVCLRAVLSKVVIIGTNRVIEGTFGGARWEAETLYGSGSAVSNYFSRSAGMATWAKNNWPTNQ